MLFRAFAGFHGLLVLGRLPARMDNALTKQALSCIGGGAHDEHSAMLFRTFAVYIKLGCEMRHSDDIRKLRQESANLEASVAALNSDERRVRSDAIRKELTISGKWREPNDTEALERFVRGDFGLSELAEHFYGRM